MTYLIALLNKIIAIVKNINRVPHDAIAGEKLDFSTNTPNILSRKINKKPNDTPIARLERISKIETENDIKTSKMIFLK